MNATESGYKQVCRLNVGDQIYLYGNRKVLGVKNIHALYGENTLKLITNDGSFMVNKFTLVAPAGDYSHNKD